jgi:hypothetical protein
MTEPELALSNPAQSPNRVVFPEPEGPTIEKVSPASILKLTLCKTRRLLSPLLYDLVKLITSNMKFLILLINDYLFSPLSV